MCKKTLLALCGEGIVGQEQHLNVACLLQPLSSHLGPSSKAILTSPNQCSPLPPCPQPCWPLCLYPACPLRPQFEGHASKETLSSSQASVEILFVLVTCVSPGPAQCHLRGTHGACVLSEWTSVHSWGEQINCSLLLEHSGGPGAPCQWQPPKVDTWGRRWALGSPGKQGVRQAEVALQG